MIRDVVYYERRPSDEEPRPGCLDALLITRVVFGILFWPMVVLIAVFMDVAFIFILYVTYPPLALIPVGVTALAVWLFARWEQRRFRPPGV